MATRYLVYTNDEESDQDYFPDAAWEFDSRQPDPRNGETAEREVYMVTLLPDEHEREYPGLIKAKLNADRCVVYWCSPDA